MIKKYIKNIIFLLSRLIILILNLNTLYYFSLISLNTFNIIIKDKTNCDVWFMGQVYGY